MYSAFCQFSESIDCSLDVCQLCLERELRTCCKRCGRECGNEDSLRLHFRVSDDAELELTSNADWVDDLVVSHTFVGFTVAANEGAERDAQITLSYNGESATIDIHQAEYSANRPFTITIESLSSTTCVTRVDAVDDTMDYIM